MCFKRQREKKGQKGRRPVTRLSATRLQVTEGGFIWGRQRKPSCVANDPPPPLLLNGQTRREEAWQQPAGTRVRGRGMKDTSTELGADGVQPACFLSAADQLRFKDLGAHAQKRDAHPKS